MIWICSTWNRLEIRVHSGSYEDARIYIVRYCTHRGNSTNRYCIEDIGNIVTSELGKTTKIRTIIPTRGRNGQPGEPQDKLHKCARHSSKSPFLLERRAIRYHNAFDLKTLEQKIGHDSVLPDRY